MYKRILVATDGSKLAQVAVDHGIKLAALTGAELVATQITPRYPKSYFEGSLPLSSEEVKRIEA
ncbi:MAG: universal stress protein, partial [Hylemonella sp.]|nr:universal stress protein [Hylemonella sp.]